MAGYWRKDFSRPGPPLFLFLPHCLSIIPSMSSAARQRLSFLLLLIPTTATLAFLSPAIFSATPSLVAAASDVNSPSSNTALCSYNGETTNMAPPVPRWYQHEISITAPSRGCHLITSQVSVVLHFIGCELILITFTCWDVLELRIIRIYSPVAKCKLN